MATKTEQMAKSVLVTGGAGYIGSHTCKALAAAGYTPVAIDDLSTGNRSFVQWGPFERVDVNDAAAMDAICARSRPQAILHFAGLIAAGESVVEPARYYRSNLDGLLSVVECCRRNRIRSLIFSSSAAVYGEPLYVPIDESHPTAPVNPYGHTKLIGERIIADSAGAYDFKAASLRYFNASGADPDGELGEAHALETHLVPLALRAAFDRSFVLPIFGDDYPTADGTAIRDYVHVSDIARAHVLALQSIETHRQNLVLNIGTGRGFSVREIIDTVSRITGRAVKTRSHTRRPGDPAALVADPKRSREILNWTPTLSNLDSIVSTACSWYQKGSTTLAESRERPPVL